jgi:hypothetical protein
VHLSGLGDETGFTSLQFAVMAFFSMLILAAAVNVVAIQYQLGVVRVAVDEGARHGAAVGSSTDDCRLRAESVIRGESGLLRGALGQDIEVSCRELNGEIIATATGVSPWWIGGLPDDEFVYEGRAVLETFAEEW